jgi:hypothetical protein
MSRDLAISVSLAGLCHLRTLCRIAFYNKNDLFLMKEPPSSSDLLAMFVHVTTLAAFLFAIRRYSRVHNRGVGFWLAEAAFLFFVLIGANMVRSEAVAIWSGADKTFGVTRWITLNAVLAVIALVGLLIAYRHALRIVSTVLLLLSPLVPIAFGRATWNALRRTPLAYADAVRPVSPPRAPRSATRVVWIIFDEWDYGLSFVDRAKETQLTEVDGLRKTAFEATQAVPPASQTILSIPSLLTGKIVSKAEGINPDQLLLTFRESNVPIPLSESRTVFSVAFAEGFRTAIAGWYLPYCRMLNGHLSACTWSDNVNLPAPQATFRDLLWNHARVMFETNRFSLFPATLAMQKHERIYRDSLHAADAYVRDQNLDLVLLHFNIPHAPTINGENPLSRGNPEQWYSDNLALLDRTWGQLRSSMQAAGTWDNTTVVLSSDHSLRTRRADGKADHRIPFLAHFARQQQPVRCDLRFNTILTPEIILAVLRGQLSSADSLQSWLRNRLHPM